MRKKSTYRLFATGNRYGMTESDYKLFQKEITGIESPAGLLKSRLRVYYANSGTNLKHYMNLYFRSYYKSVDNDYSKNRVVFICDDETTRNKLAAILSAIRNDVPYDIPETPTGGGGDNPPPTGGGGDNPPPTGGGTDDLKPAAQSKTTTYLLIAGAMILAIVLVIKFVK
ncbi:MAG: hypothetical protein RBT49_11835 [Bacteroidales bacterium]|jgi:hypothetical protein|nr:hypothetical protein [Bacteroidales bacterium]